MSTNFTLRTPSHIKSCHVTGSWDSYKKRYEMATEPGMGPGYWSLNLNFASLPPSRYFYYFILDGYFESHDPNHQTVVEPTRKLTLNIFDHGIPSPSGSSRRSSSSRSSSSGSSTSSKRSGGVYDLPSPLDSEEPYYFSSVGPHANILQPKPRNPMAAHKLTVDTSYYRGRSVSPSSSSNRSGSSCSSYSSGGSSPATPIYESDEEEYYYSPAPRKEESEYYHRVGRIAHR